MVKLEKNPWSGICCEACWNARHERCTCKCGGKHHGKGSGVKASKAALGDQQHFMASPEAQIYARLIRDWQCTGCEHDLHGEPILGYGHTAGFPVKGHEQNQWLFITCPVCGYQNSLIKMGVPSDATYEDAERAPPVTKPQDADVDDEEHRWGAA